MPHTGRQLKELGWGVIMKDHTRNFILSTNYCNFYMSIKTIISRQEKVQIIPLSLSSLWITPTLLNYLFYRSSKIHERSLNLSCSVTQVPSILGT